MEFSWEDILTLRLLRAFAKIKDPQTRREILAVVESKARAQNDDPNSEQPNPRR
jgi:hypothetical protein